VLVVGVELRDFRTYARAEARLGTGLTVVHGPNGAGKSNLLEAVYFGCTGRSPRTRNDRELLRFGSRTARVAVRLSDGRRAHELTVGFGSPAGATQPVKRMTVDGAAVERLLDVETRPLVSVFLADRLELVKGPPAARRAHLDQLVAALWPLRAATRREYSRVLAQRNALLARIRVDRAARESLSAWDEELARSAVAVMDDRRQAVELLSEPFATRGAGLGCSGELRLAYRPRSRASDAGEFRAELERHLERDLERGFTGHGPHRDELSVLRDERELRVFGSQGEQRLALLALLLGERHVLARERTQTPLMLLDDVMSELDGERRELLTRELASGGQSVIATTDLSHVPGACDAAVTRLRISPGAILQEAIAA